MGSDPTELERERAPSTSPPDTPTPPHHAPHLPPMLDQTLPPDDIHLEEGDALKPHAHHDHHHDYSSNTPAPAFPPPAGSTPNVHHDLHARPVSLIHNPRYSASFASLTCGAWLSRFPILMWIVCCSVPLGYIVLMFGGIPIGERLDEDDVGPGRHRFYHYWIFTCVVNPINMMIISYLNCGIFLSCMGVARPFRVHWSIVVLVFVVQVIVFNLIVPFTGTFDFLGVAAVFLCYATTFLGIYYYETWKATKRCVSSSELESELAVLHRYFWQYFKVAVAFLIFFLVLLLYLWAYAHVSSVFGQKILPFSMTVGVFIVRKVMLALTDPFPLNTAMLISGFWVENIYDMFQTMAYRNVKDPVNYVSIWFTNALSLLANVVFLLDTWFEFRIWIKAYLPKLFKGQAKPWRLGIEPDFSEDPNERGHSTNKIGYHRRQARFFMYKVFSKCIAALFYLLISTVLRYGENAALFPFQTDTDREYINSLQFSVYNFIFLVLAGGVAFVFAKFRHPKLIDHFRRQANETLTSRYMVGAIVALLINNGILAVSMMMYFNQIYYVVRKE